jgi:hypothetical protein
MHGLKDHLLIKSYFPIVIENGLYLLTSVNKIMPSLNLVKHLLSGISKKGKREE